MAAGLDMDSNPVFRSFIGYATIMLLKTLVMSFLTARQRMTKKVFPAEEDLVYFKDKKAVVSTTDPDVERVRRAHRNDLENIIPFVLLGLLYSATGPNLTVALLHFRIFTAARILHTVVYLGAIRQPFRAIGFALGQFVNLSIVFQLLRAASF